MFEYIIVCECDQFIFLKYRANIRISLDHLITLKDVEEYKNQLKEKAHTDTVIVLNIVFLGKTEDK